MSKLYPTRLPHDPPCPDPRAVAHFRAGRHWQPWPGGSSVTLQPSEAIGAVAPEATIADGAAQQTDQIKEW